METHQIIKSKLKTIHFIIVFALSTFHLFGQVNQPIEKDTLKKMGTIVQFFINDTPIDNEWKNCFALTKGFQIKDIITNDMKLEGAEIINGCLKIDLTYGCGCGPIYLKLFVDTTIDLINEPAIHLFPQFADLDFCKALCQCSVYFDLSSIIDRRKKPLIIQIGKFNLTMLQK